MDNENIFDKLQTTQNEKFISEMGMFDANITNAWEKEQGYLKSDSEQANKIKKKQAENKEKEKQLKEQRKEELKYDPKLLQAGYDRLQQELSENMRKLKHDYENANNHLKSAKNAISELKTALNAKQYQKANEHYKKASAELNEGIKIFNEETENSI
jgi:hypothetical protein